MRNEGMQYSGTALIEKNALQSDANQNYSLFTIHYLRTFQGGV